MGPFVVSSVLQIAEQLESGSDSIALHGANLTIAATFRMLLQLPEVDVLEIYLPPAEAGRLEYLAGIARSVLPSWRRGTGTFRIYPIQALPEIWQDARPRIMLSVDIELLARDRYLRDRFAVAPTPITCQTHGLGSHSLYTALDRVARAEAVPYDSITCLSRATQRSMQQTFESYLAPGLPTPCRLDVLPNGVDTEFYRPFRPDEKRHARRMLGLPVDGTLTLYLARLTPNSKADLLPFLRQFARVSGTSDHLLIAGIENIAGYGKRLLEESAALGIGERVMLRSPVEAWAAPLYYGSADLYVLPTDNAQECFANTTVEAMAAGLPVIASAWTGPKDTVLDGETGYLIPTYLLPGLAAIEATSPANPFMSNLLMVAQNTYIDSQAMGEALSQLLESPEQRQRMGAAARKRMEEVFSWDIVNQRRLALWDAQMAETMAEPEADRIRRRDAADSIGLPIPFRTLFGDSGTRSADPERDWIRTSPHGREVIDGRVKATFYDETLPLIRPEIMEALRLSLGESRRWRPMAEIARAAARRSGLSEDLVYFHLGLMLKRDLLEFKAWDSLQKDGESE